MFISNVLLTLLVDFNLKSFKKIQTLNTNLTVIFSWYMKENFLLYLNFIGIYRKSETRTKKTRFLFISYFISKISDNRWNKKDERRTFNLHIL